MSATPYPTQQTVITQQPQTVIVQRPENEYPSFIARRAVSTGGIQLILGILAIVFQICATAIEAEHGAVAVGIWAGFFFLVAGCIGLTTRKKSCCKITFYGIFSFIAFLCAIALLIVAAIGVDNDQETKEKFCWKYDDCPDWWDHSDDDCGDVASRYHEECAKYNARIAMNAMLIIFALIEIVIALYAVVICIQGFCGGKTPKQATVPTVAQTGQAVVFIPTANAPRQYIAYPQAPPAQPVAPPAYDPTAPPAYVYYGSGPPQDEASPSTFDNPTYQVDPPHNIYATADNRINENKDKEGY